ncbi:MAG: UPF0716 protein FxsA [Candidatus Azotimanducaceae bacterium]|jgi:UPF0716 protein FxsA
MRFGLLLFITIPIAEMYLLILVGSHIGALPTIGLVVLTATVGLWLLKLEGLATLVRLQDRINQGEIPGQELLEGIMLLIGGALLLTPGFFTDGIGFVCLIPMLRKPIAQWLISRGMIGALGNIHVGGNRVWPDQDDSTIIEGEFEEQHPKRPPLTKKDPR